MHSRLEALLSHCYCSRYILVNVRGVTSNRRIAALEEFEKAAGDHPTVEGALHAFLDTDLDLYFEAGEAWMNYGAFGARVSNTPEGAALMNTLARTGRIDRLSGGICRSDDFPAVKKRMANFMAAGFLTLRQDR